MHMLTTIERYLCRSFMEKF